MKDKITVVIPMYNAEKYIEMNLKNIFEQTYKEIEVIVVDDGSTDNSAKIVEENFKKEIDSKKLILIKNNNFGAPFARNTGMNLARGEYITFLDADDYLDIYALEKMHNKIIKDDSELVVCNASTIDENNKIKVHNYFFKDINNRFSFSPCPLGKLYKMSVIKNNNIYWENIRISQDLNFYLKYLCCTDKISVINEDIGYYRVLSDSISHAKNFNMMDITKSFELIKRFYVKNGKYNNFKEQINECEINHLESQMSRGIKNFTDFTYRKFISKFFINEVKKINKNELNKNTRKIIFKMKLKAFFHEFYYFRSIIFKKR